MTTALIILAIVIAAVAALRYLNRRPRAPIQVTREANEWSNRYYGGTQCCDTAARFISILQEYGPADLARVAPDTTFVKDLGLDDLEPVEILLAVEDEFKITVSEDDAARLMSVGQVIDYLEKRKNEN
jgi:acyl carrier protein